jgi:hypothetical protein
MNRAEKVILAKFIAGAVIIGVLSIFVHSLIWLMPIYLVGWFSWLMLKAVAAFVSFFFEKIGLGDSTILRTIAVVIIWGIIELIVVIALALTLPALLMPH